MHTIHTSELTQMPNVRTKSLVEFRVIPVDLDDTRLEIKEGSLISNAYYEHNGLEVVGVPGHADVYVYRVENSVYGADYAFGYELDLDGVAEEHRDAFKSAAIDFVSNI